SSVRTSPRSPASRVQPTAQRASSLRNGRDVLAPSPRTSAASSSAPPPVPLNSTWLPAMAVRTPSRGASVPGRPVYAGGTIRTVRSASGAEAGGDGADDSATGPGPWLPDPPHAAHTVVGPPDVAIEIRAHTAMSPPPMAAPRV